MVLASTASCGDEVLSAAFTSLQELTLTLIQIGFESLQFGFEDAETTQVTVRAITDAMSCLLA